MTTDQPIAWTIQDILKATHGELLGGERQRPFSNVFIDSRKISIDGIYVAIIGEIHDGHKFLPDVMDQGVSGVVISREKAEQLPISAWGKKRVVCIAVEDTTRALGDMAAFNRRRSRASIVGITGSNGKTTTRQMTAAVASQQYRTLETAGNFNNEIGLPLTLLGLDPGHQCAVVELGTNNPGEIARLAAICSPDIGVITNIGPAHLEGLGSIEGVAREKGSLLHGLRKHGQAVLNADDPRVLQLAQQAPKEVVLYGMSAKAEVRATAVIENEKGITFTLEHAEESMPVQLNTPGRFMITNALAAAAVGIQLGLSYDKIKAGLQSFTPVSGRMNILHLPNQVHIIDDTYNANPASMEVALTTLQKMRTGSRGVFVAGDMLELGDQASPLHIRIGTQAAQTGISRLYARGEYADKVASGAIEAGMAAADMITGSHAEIIADLTEWLRPGDWVLVKGSRGMAMEKVVLGLKEWTKEIKG